MGSKAKGLQGSIQTNRHLENLHRPGMCWVLAGASCIIEPIQEMHIEIRICFSLHWLGYSRKMGVFWVLNYLKIYAEKLKGNN